MRNDTHLPAVPSHPPSEEAPVTVLSTLGFEVTVTSDCIDETPLVTLEVTTSHGLVDLTPGAARTLASALNRHADHSERLVSKSAPTVRISTIP
ncbi:hypothetical protein [Rhodococcus sp. (in: high G+C Gram-positive bacteria)]|uniref:hypothetical protein n=1 Tax=Rhodococcus sp. TaxID=1831 RepID=UPI00257CC5AF|nr:hypothetical protein [Rhodococcus sp. (in: high G+C Gram-positive bacteria)]MBQ7807847.1 hypothetical protein [Rhodococcus sp. (in: high G+C Gram-positive bacteria)]